MSVPTVSYRHVPLFRALSDAQLHALLGVFTERRLKAGETLFREGDAATHLQLLVSGEIELREEKEPKVVVRPVSPLGELGALSGVPRHTTAIALTDISIVEVEVAKLDRFFAENAELGLAFHKSLLEVVGDKVRRDRKRLDDMRANIIRTQKSMKAAREILLSNEETAISKPLCEALDELLENNRRAHYRVMPIVGHDALVKLGTADGEKSVKVIELSEGFIKFEGPSKWSQGAELSAVLSLPQREIPVSGKVVRADHDGVLVKLDLLIDDYSGVFLGYVTQLQLLDFVV